MSSRDWSRIAAKLNHNKVTLDKKCNEYRNNSKQNHLKWNEHEENMIAQNMIGLKMFILPNEIKKLTFICKTNFNLDHSTMQL